ncbi:MAG: hypothetical protein WAS49_03130 [Candidatus Dechloromonas phosphoritropha]|nr:hypothetical protein [Azonexus sp.]MBP9228752.1 hypothetical protein [Azonexus sp.]
MFDDFFLLEREGEPAVRAERLAFGETSGRNETWLRDTLFEHPELLPLKDIDPSFGPLIPLCKELQTEAGPLDIAFINQYGRLTLVECKLWRNPEARRKVVAQVLDYARAISRWSYSDLQRQVASVLGRKGNIPFELVQAVMPGLKEQEFVDNAYSAMRSGRFLLLIAGDGIREDVGALAELINRNAASGFAFSLVEVALYGFEDGGIVVQPRAIAKTQIIERTVVLIRESGRLEVVSEEDELGTEASAGQVDRSTDRNELGESPKQAEYRAWWKQVLEMQFDDPDQEPPKLYWPNNVRVMLPWPQIWITAYRLGGDAGKIGVFLGGRRPGYTEMIEALAQQSEEILAELPENTAFRLGIGGGEFTFATQLPASDFPDDELKKR